MENIIIIAVILLILGASAFYLIRAKKAGRHCVGCPHSGSCRKRRVGKTKKNLPRCKKELPDIK